MILSLASILASATHYGFCSNTPMPYLSSFYDGSGKNETLVGAVRLFHGGQLVGWLYRASNNRYYVQALRNMPDHDLLEVPSHDTLGIRYTPGFVPHSRGPATGYSGLAEISKWPWHDVYYAPCDP